MRSASPVSAAPAWSAGGEGERLWFLGALAIVRVPGEAVEGRFALVEFVFPRHVSTLPPPYAPRPTPEEVERNECIEVGPRLGPED